MKVKEFLSDPIHVGIVSVLTTVLVILAGYTLYIEDAKHGVSVAPTPKAPTKSLLLREANLINVDALIKQARLKGYEPSQKYIIDYILVNNGDIPIVTGDFSVPTAIITSAPNEIKEVISANPGDIQGKGAGSQWTQISKTEWRLQPRLLNPNQQMPFTVTFEAGTHPLPPAYSPESDLNWRWDVVGVLDVPTVASFPAPDSPVADYSMQYFRTLNFLNGEVSFLKINTYFSFIVYEGNSVYLFLVIGIVFYIIALWVLISRIERHENVYTMIGRCILLLILSYSLSDAVTTFATHPIKEVEIYNYGALLPYVGYLAYLIAIQKKRIAEVD